jgi:hypothetical protein
MQDYREWLAALAELEKAAAKIGPEAVSAPAWDILPDNAPVAMVCSPHPDDEVITGALALRLRREGWRVVNLAITLGSAKERKEARRAELEACCRLLGFELQIAGGELGLDHIRLETRREDPTAWGMAVMAVATQFQRWKPKVVMLPHAADHHPTHIGTHWLARDGLTACRLLERTWLVETEFWGAMAEPNLLVSSSLEELAILLGGLRQHVGEVARNPYHLRLPAWMSDNVRRGSELLGGAGAAAFSARYGTLYRLSVAGEAVPVQCLADSESASALFQL